MKNSEKKYNVLERDLIDFYEEKQSELFGHCHPKIAQSRLQAFDYLKSNGLPTTALESWKNTNLEQHYNDSFQLDNPVTKFEKSIGEIFQCEVHGFDTDVISMLNGRYYSPEEKHLQTLDNGVVVGSIIAAQNAYPELFDTYFDETAGDQQNGLCAANKAIFRDGVFVYVPDGV